jgi:hypothetical protein
MTRTITDKVVATVVEVTDLGELFPASVLKGQIGLDVRVEQGSFCTGKRVRLHGLGSEEELEITGIEMLHNPHDQNVVRILCSKPKTLELLTGELRGWLITEPSTPRAAEAAGGDKIGADGENASPTEEREVNNGSEVHRAQGAGYLSLARSPRDRSSSLPNSSASRRQPFFRAILVAAPRNGHSGDDSVCPRPRDGGDFVGELSRPESLAPSLEDTPIIFSIAGTSTREEVFVHGSHGNHGKGILADHRPSQTSNDEGQ